MGSELLAAPADGLDIETLQGTTEAVLASGADIGEFNAIRKHCSAIKGGHLARAALADNDAGGFLDRHDGLIVTGPTTTNVNDLRVFVVPDLA